MCSTPRIVKMRVVRSFADVTNPDTYLASTLSRRHWLLLDGNSGTGIAHTLFSRCIKPSPKLQDVLDYKKF
jgi:hypothetical protein